MTSPLDRMILASVKCTMCGAGYGKCDCWQKCQKCGRSFEKGKQCRNCAGDSSPEIVAMAKPRRRRKSTPPPTPKP